MASSRPFRFVSELRAAFAERVRRWARKRQGDDSLPLTLEARRVYILPTRLGVAAAVLLFVMLLAGLNYENSLALMLCFLLSGLTLVSMHECHRTLAGMGVTEARGESAFAQHDGCLQLTFTNGRTIARTALEIRYEDCQSTLFSLEPAAVLPVRPVYRLGRRGRHRIERLQVWTEAPLGLFRAWSWLYLPLDVMVYPAPAGNAPLPGGHGRPRSESRVSVAGGDQEWAWLRPFQESDSPRSVAWKAYARGAPLMVAHYQTAAGAERLLDFDALTGLGTEQRLSQLTRWVLECERRLERYALRLPSRSLKAGLGPAHRRQCLEALAMYDL
ncbi:MAG TPA: DUF58 domain-containing protein [Steroidobacteraceae bacterium]|jgi:uncharacterized protein (DUF58 family)|nr:DUF58 domain-containing protein [Steroidobacteraceae bacterium]